MPTRTLLQYTYSTKVTKSFIGLEYSRDVKGAAYQILMLSIVFMRNVRTRWHAYVSSNFP